MSEITSVSKRKYQSVAANTVVEDEYTVPEGTKLYFERCGGNAAVDCCIKIEIKFGDDVLFSTHGDDRQEPNEICLGDGSKKITLRLCNDSDIAETVGGWWSGWYNEE